MKRTIALIAAIVALIAVAIPSVGAQDCPASTVTVTETQINSSFYVTNPINRNVSNAHVDLQAGQAVLSATYTWRTGSGLTSANVVEVVTPTVTNGRVYWNVVSVTANGQPASADLINQINAHLNASWYRWISEHAPAGVVTAVTITDSDITYTYTSCPITSGGSTGSTSGSGSSATPVPVSGTSGTFTVTEAQINSSFYVTNPINRRISDVNVDLQAANGGQVVLLATYTWRTGAGVEASADVVEVIAPTLTNGRVYWNVVSVTANGQPASADLVSQINAHLNASWYRWISEHAPAGHITAVTITDSDITYSY